MFGTVARYPTRNNFAAFRNEMSQDIIVFIGDFEGLICTESADFPFFIICFFSAALSAVIQRFLPNDF
jgi:hypothetical protein